MPFRNRRRPIRHQLRLSIISALLLGILLGSSATHYYGLPVAPESIQVRFTPGDRCTDWVVQTIAQAQASIWVQAYYLTSEDIAQALIDAHRRGVEVSVLVDRSQLTHKHAQTYQLLAQGIPVAVDKVSGIAHNKVMIFDGRRVLTGSFNWTQSAEKRNAENLILIDSTEIARRYQKNWQLRAQQAQPIQQRKAK